MGTKVHYVFGVMLFSTLTTTEIMWAKMCAVQHVKISYSRCTDRC